MTDVRLTATNPEDSSAVPVACNDKGELKLEEPITFDGNLDGDLTVSGSASSGVHLSVGGSWPTDDGVYMWDGGYHYIRNDEGTSGSDAVGCLRIYRNGAEQKDITLNILNSGEAMFAGGKAGFTAEGYLWCTTRRGDTVILDATQGGIGAWADYDPTLRLKEKLEAQGDESDKLSQDSPET